MIGKEHLFGKWGDRTEKKGIEVMASEIKMDENKKKTLIGTIVIGVLFLGFLVFVALTQFRKPSGDKADDTVSIVIPDGEAAQMPGSKRAAYQDRRSGAFDAYFGELPPDSDGQLGSLVSSAHDSGKDRPADQAF